jgi:hypothetical protein
MKKYQLEHVIRAAAGITGSDEFVIIGSQAILAQHSDLPEELAESMEADIFSLRSLQEADLIDGSIGEESPFHQTFGYYAHGVGEETATLPVGWKDRLVPLHTPNTGGATGLCLEVHDLAASKLVAGREKDLTYIQALFRHGFADPEIVQDRLKATPLTDEIRRLCLTRLQRVTPTRS